MKDSGVKPGRTSLEDEMTSKYKRERQFAGRITIAIIIIIILVQID